MANKQALIVFAKPPLSGQVKSRLAASIGAKKALEVYQLMLEHTKQLADSAGADVYWYWSRHYAEPQQQSYIYHNQPEGNLGYRMNQAFADVAPHYQATILIGTDCVELRPFHLTESFASLQTNDVVLTPANDGGYVLVGMRKPQPQLFTLTEWSHPLVLEQTLKIANSLRLKYRVNSTLVDVDTLADWHLADKTKALALFKL